MLLAIVGVLAVAVFLALLTSTIRSTSAGVDGLTAKIRAATAWLEDRNRRDRERKP